MRQARTHHSARSSRPMTDAICRQSDRLKDPPTSMGFGLWAADRRGVPFVRGCVAARLRGCTGPSRTPARLAADVALKRLARRQHGSFLREAQPPNQVIHARLRRGSIAEREAGRFVRYALDGLSLYGLALDHSRAQFLLTKEHIVLQKAVVPHRCCSDAECPTRSLDWLRSYYSNPRRTRRKRC